MSLEQELLNATGVIPDEFKNRRKMLEAIVRTINKLPEDGYNELSDAAIEWYESSVKAMNNKPPKAPPEIEMASPKPEPEDDEEYEDDEDADEEPEADEDDEDEPEVEEAQAEVLSPSIDQGTAELEASVLSDRDDVADPEPAPRKQKKGKAKKAKAPKPPTKAELERAAGGPSRYEKMIKYGGTKNRYGVYEGTKAHDAILMFEKGATMAEIRDAVGDTKYNLKRDLIKAGHLFEKDGKKFKLTHKDDVDKKPKSKKK